MEKKRKRQPAVLVSGTKSMDWLMPIVAEISNDSGVDKAALFRTAFCEYFQNHHPELKRKYQAWKKVRGR